MSKHRGRCCFGLAEGEIGLGVYRVAAPSAFEPVALLAANAPVREVPLPLLPPVLIISFRVEAQDVVRLIRHSCLGPWDVHPITILTVSRPH